MTKIRKVNIELYRAELVAKCPFCGVNFNSKSDNSKCKHFYREDLLSGTVTFIKSSGMRYILESTFVGDNSYTFKNYDYAMRKLAKLNSCGNRYYLTVNYEGDEL